MLFQRPRRPQAKLYLRWVISAERSRLDRRMTMGTRAAVTLYVALMVALIVAVDFRFFRNRFWERLTVNIGIVLVFAAFYLRFLKTHP